MPHALSTGGFAATTAGIPAFGTVEPHTVPPHLDEDLLTLLVTTYLTAMQRHLARPLPFVLDPSALALLREYEWPGQLVEFKSVLRKLAFLCMHRRHIYAADVGAVLRRRASDSKPSPASYRLEEIIVTHPDAPRWASAPFPSESLCDYFRRQLINIFDYHTGRGLDGDAIARQIGIEPALLSQKLNSARPLNTPHNHAASLRKFLEN